MKPQLLKQLQKKLQFVEDKKSQAKETPAVEATEDATEIPTVESTESVDDSEPIDE